MNHLNFSRSPAGCRKGEHEYKIRVDNFKYVTIVSHIQAASAASTAIGFFALFLFGWRKRLLWHWNVFFCAFLYRWLSPFSQIIRLFRFVAEIITKICLNAVKMRHFLMGLRLSALIYTSLFPLLSYWAHIAIWNETCGNISITFRTSNLVLCEWWHWTLQCI